MTKSNDSLVRQYLPTSIVLPFEVHARQSKLMHAQVSQGKAVYIDLWLQIINRKKSNQARALSIMGMEGAENRYKVPSIYHLLSAVLLP